MPINVRNEGTQFRHYSENSITRKNQTLRKGIYYSVSTDIVDRVLCKFNFNIFFNIFYIDLIWDLWQTILFYSEISTKNPFIPTESGRPCGWLLLHQRHWMPCYIKWDAHMSNFPWKMQDCIIYNIRGKSPWRCLWLQHWCMLPWNRCSEHILLHVLK